MKKNNLLKKWIKGKYFYFLDMKEFNKIWEKHKEDIYTFLCSKSYKKIQKGL